MAGLWARFPQRRAKSIASPSSRWFPDSSLSRPTTLRTSRRSSRSDVCAVLIETIQGEGGIRPLKEEFYRAVRRLTSESGALLVADEIQCGLGRTGQWFAFHQWIDPSDRRDASRHDCVRKAARVSEFRWAPSSSRNTWQRRSGPASMGRHSAAVRLRAARVLSTSRSSKTKSCSDHIRETGAYFKSRLEELKDLPVVKEVRGIGLMLADRVERSGQGLRQEDARARIHHQLHARHGAAVPAAFHHHVEADRQDRARASRRALAEA